MKKYLITLVLALLSLAAFASGGEGAEVAGAMLLTVFSVVVVIAAAIGLYVAVALLAKRYNRNIVIWLLLSFIASPFLIIVILLCIGKAEEKEIY